ncbi:MAG: hypothetical protein U1F45_02025 [Burkholderiales bacterium]
MALSMHDRPFSASSVTRARLRQHQRDELAVLGRVVHDQDLPRQELQRACAGRGLLLDVRRLGQVERIHPGERTGVERRGRTCCPYRPRSSP